MSTDISEKIENGSNEFGCLPGVLSFVSLAFAIYAVVYVKGFWLCCGMFCTVFFGGMICGSIGMSIGNAIRKFAKPDFLITNGGISDIIRLKLFWMYGPSAIGGVIGWVLGVHLLLMLFWGIPLESVGKAKIISDTKSEKTSISETISDIKSNVAFVQKMKNADLRTKQEALLMVAIDANSIVTVRELLAEKVDIQRKRLKLNEQGIPFRGNPEASPLFAALSHAFDRSEIALLLIQNGADVNEYDCQFKGPTPLLFVLRNDMPSLIMPLLQKGARVDVVDVDGKTPLHHAANLNLEKEAYLMIKSGALLNVKDKYGHTPLDYASPDMRMKMIRWNENKTVK